MQKRSILVQFLRHCGFWLTTSDDVNIVIDPILSSRYKGVELIPPPFEPTAIEKADAILITHLHPDHCDEETIHAIAKKTNAEVIAPSDAINELDLSNIKTRGVKTGDSLSIKSVKIHVISAGKYGWWDSEKANLGYKMMTGDKIGLLHSSDSLPLIEDAMGMHVLFIRVAWKPKAKARMIELVKKISPKFVIPMHYGTYTSVRADPEEIRDEVETKNTRILVFYPGQIRKIQFRSLKWQILRFGVKSTLATPCVEAVAIGVASV